MKRINLILRETKCFNSLKFLKFNFCYKIGVSSAIVTAGKKVKMVITIKVLLLKREHEPFKNLWCFPGGKIEDKEKYPEATIREIFEETGLRVKLPRTHLLKITYIKQYMIITSLSILDDKCNNNLPDDDDLTFHIEKGEVFYCKWFSEKEANTLKDDEVVPGIKEVLSRALELYGLNKKDNIKVV